MKISISFTEFKKGMKELNNLKTKGTDQIESLENIIVKTVSKDNTIQLIKGSLISILQVNCFANIEQSGTIVLPSSTIKLINSVKKGDKLTITDKYIQIDSKKINFEYISIDTIPKLEFKSTIKKFEVTEKELYRLLEVNYAVSKEDIRPVLTGINIKDNKFAALDGYRLSIRQSDQFNSDLNVTMSSEQWTVLLKLINKKSDGKICVYTNEKNAYLKFEINNTLFESRLLNQEYIRYESIVPDVNDAGTKIEITDSEILDKLQLVSKLQADKNVIVKLNISDNIELKASDIHNTITDSIDGTKEGSNLQIAFNVKYLLEYFKHCINKVNMYLYNSISPALFTQDNKNIDIILPVRLV